MKERADLAAPLAARLVPVLALVGAIVTISAPLAYHWMGAGELRERAAADAQQIAELLAREAGERPVLWRYDSLRLLEHVRAYRAHPSVARIEVVDAAGRLLDPAAEPSAGDLLWRDAPITVWGDRVGSVWIGMELAPLRARSAALLGAFGVLALALGALVYAIAMRTARAAESEIDVLVETVARAHAEQRTRALGVRAVIAQEEERRAIARDLHDSIGQSLAAMRIQAELVITRAGDAAAVERAARKIATTSDTALEEVRRTLARLGPASLDELGLEGALGRLAEDLGDSGITVSTTIGPALGAGPALEATAYRIVQEALTNAARHAQASSVDVELTREGDTLIVTVGDDGRGGARELPGHGVRAMRERAELLGGSLVIETSAEGTYVRAVLPLRADAGAA